MLSLSYQILEHARLIPYTDSLSHSTAPAKRGYRKLHKAGHGNCMVRRQIAS